MKTLILAALFSLPVAPATPPPTTAVREHLAQKPVQHGRWYMAETGHAVFCVGPVVTVPDHDGSLVHVATFCHGPEPVVPVHD